MLYSSSTAAYLWKRDPEVEEVIEHLDQPARKGNWDALKKSELAWIEREMLRCQDDFVWAARNYF